MNSVEKVKALCKKRKIAISRLEKDLGYSNGYIGQLRKGVFPSDRLVQIADYLNVPIDYLMNAEPQKKNELTAKDDAEKQLLSSFRKLNGTGKGKVVDYAADMTQNPNYTRPSVPVLQAAHNDHAEDPEELEKMKHDMDMIKEIHKKLNS